MRPYRLFKKQILDMFQNLSHVVHDTVRVPSLLVAYLLLCLVAAMMLGQQHNKGQTLSVSTFLDKADKYYVCSKE